jgi:protein arginine kinase
MVVDELIKHPGSWLSTDVEEDAGIVVSSRMRLARNVKGVPFPGWAADRDRVALCARLRAAFDALPSISGAQFFDMGETSPVDKLVLRERHLISPELAERGHGSALIVAPDERIAVMINEEDHLRLQVMSPGMHLDEAWARIDRVDTELDHRVDYAFSRELGYLTACPTNVGTGLRASVMLNLTGLKLMQEIGPVINGLEKIGFAVRGLLGEGTEAYGDMFQVSNQSTLGESELGIISRLSTIVRQIARYERNARIRLAQERRAFLEDQVGRAYGILMHARILTSREAMDLLSGLRLGLEYNILSGLQETQINELILVTQPGHLQKMAGRELDADARDAVRASIVRERLAGVAVNAN